MQLDVRPATSLDITGYIELFEVVAGEGTWIGAEPPLDHRRLAAGVEDAAATPGAEVLVAIDGDTVVGAISLRLDRGVVELGMLVSPDFRRQGTGRRLLDEGITWARSTGAHKVALEVWPHNGSAIALYLGAGFVIEGRLRRHHRRSSGQLWDSLAMGLLLDVDSPDSPYPDASTAIG